MRERETHDDPRYSWSGLLSSFLFFSCQERLRLKETKEVRRGETKREISVTRHQETTLMMTVKT